MTEKCLDYVILKCHICNITRAATAKNMGGFFCKQSVSQKKCGWNTRLEKMNKKGLQNNRQNLWYLNNMFVD